MHLRGTMSRVPTLASFEVRYKKSFGHKFRDFIALCGHYCSPIKKYVFPNFIAVHYFYTIVLTIITSIMLYPVKNIRYIDALFLAAGAVTQGGLNTVDVNNLTLYQQIILYLICCISTPIAVHSCLAFVRLYWFERYFDGIRDSSRRNFKMRRTKTILERELTAKTMTKSKTGTQRMSRPEKSDKRDDFQEKLFSGEMVNRDEQDSVHSSHSSRDSNSNSKSNNTSNNNGSSGSLDDYAKEDEADEVQRYPGNKSYSSVGSSSNTATDENISQKLKPSSLRFDESQNKRKRTGVPSEKFARRRGSRDITPEDMYRSIMMLQGEHEGTAEDEGPPLVIGSPTDGTRSTGNSNKLKSASMNDGKVKIQDKGAKISLDQDYVSHSSNSSACTSDEDSLPTNFGGTTPSLSGKTQKSSSGPIAFTEGGGADRKQGPSIQFNITKPPRRASKSKRVSTMDDLNPRSFFPHQKKTSKGYIMKHFPRAQRIRQQIKRRLSTGSIDKNSSNDALDREPVSGLDDGDDDDGNEGDNMEEYFADNESGDEDDRMQHSEPQSSSELKLKQQQQHQLQRNLHRMYKTKSFDDNRSKAVLMERSKTIDMAEARDLNELARTPDFQKMVYKNWKAHHKNKPNFKRRGWNGKMFEHGPYASDSDHNYQDNGNNSNILVHYAESILHHDNSHRNGSEDVSSDSNETTYPVNGNNDYNQNDTNGYPTYNDEEEGYYGLHFDSDYNLDPRHALTRSGTKNYLSWQPTIGRNSNFLGLTRAQKDELGGVEYRAIKLLCTILVVYYFGWHIVSFVMLVPWINLKKHYSDIVRSDGVSPTWWGFWTAMSAFNDLGLTLTPDSMMSFDKAAYPLIVMIWFIIIGNTGFPILLRCIIWIMFKLSPDLSQMRESLGFLLDHPRRCFTLLFPKAATWWLLLTLVGLNFTDWILFIILDFGSTVVKSLSKGYRVLVGLFQSVSTRTAGFSVVDLSQLHPSIQVSYMLMMYVSVLPLAISIRRTNVYEEQSLGLYGEMGSKPEDTDTEEDGDNDDDDDDDEGEEEASQEGASNRRGKPKKENKKKKKRKENENPNEVSTKSFIGAHLRKQLSFDLWFLFLGLFIICICEGDKIKDIQRPNFNVFTILFEIVSAYGTVGLSLGYPNTNQSFSRQLTTLSKLVIIAMLIRGKNRGLPYSLDRAIILPSDRLEHIDHIEDLKLKKQARTDTDDPMTEHLKRSFSDAKHRWDVLKSKSSHSRSSRRSTKTN
ncbi:Trk1p [Saccharomyces eubayanus]|uniref:Trk1p n=1 Tax=Saccharomyces eubayanus TaxID=1080349 RepID=UPI0006C5699A|nr:TRK1-like protein [Saccharomyces eubayanus]KOG98486.1 TRK1-like protein [Saccharomyces eubayanus]